MSHSPLNCLKRIVIFKNVPDSTLEKLVTKSTHQVHYKKGEIITTPESNSLIAIDKGKAKVYTLSENGKEKVLYIAENGSIIGQSNLFKTEIIPRYMQATEDTWVCSIKHNDFQEFLKAQPEVAISLLNAMGTQLINLEVNTSRRDLLKSDRRIYSYLKDWSQQAQNDKFILPMKKSEFASLLGITPETLSRQLRKLVDAGKIKVSGKIITLLD